MKKGDRVYPDIPCAHPERPVWVRGACSACYALHHHNKHKDKRLAKQRARRQERYKKEPAYREHLKAVARRTEAKKTRKDRRRQTLRGYGLTEEAHALLVKQQDNKCAICRQPETKTHRYGLLPLAIDHCHETGKIRGLLCLMCNTALGKLKDSPALLRAAIAYLEKDRK